MNDPMSMKTKVRQVVLMAFVSVLVTVSARAGISICEDDFAKSLGGWKKDKKTAEYSLSGSLYRTYRPEISPTPEGGVFLSVRIDHVRGWLSSDDHAMLEMTIGPQGIIASAKSNIAIQGRSIASEVILGANEAGKELSGANQAVQIGTDLVSDLTAKLLRENIVEAGRVSFPAAIRHNYNLLYQAVRLNGSPIQPIQAVLPLTPVAPPVKSEAAANHDAPVREPQTASVSSPVSPSPAGVAPSVEAPPVAQPVPGHAEVEIHPYAAESSAGTTEE